jgi:hypothetical protein
MKRSQVQVLVPPLESPQGIPSPCSASDVHSHSSHPIAGTAIGAGVAAKARNGLRFQLQRAASRLRGNVVTDDPLDRALARGRSSECAPQRRRRTNEYGALAQLVERLLCKQEVRGSIPLGSTTREGPDKFGAFSRFGVSVGIERPGSPPRRFRRIAPGIPGRSKPRWTVWSPAEQTGPLAEWAGGSVGERWGVDSPRLNSAVRSRDESCRGHRERDTAPTLNSPEEPRRQTAPPPRSPRGSG